MTLVNRNRNKNVTKKNAGKVSEENKEQCFLLDDFQISDELEEEGEILAEISEFLKDKKDPAKKKVIFTPFTVNNGIRHYYEKVFLTLDKVNQPNSGAADFITLFRKARSMEDIKNRVVWIELKFNHPDGDEETVFKNVIHVFESDLDDLSFEKKQVASLKESSVHSNLDDLNEEDDDDLELEDED